MPSSCVHLSRSRRTDGRHLVVDGDPGAAETRRAKIRALFLNSSEEGGKKKTSSLEVSHKYCICGSAGLEGCHWIIRLLIWQESDITQQPGVRQLQDHWQVPAYLEEGWEGGR